MDERRWERFGAACGVVFAVLVLASMFVAPMPPHIDDSISKIASYYEDNRIRVLTGQVVGTVAVIPFLFFLGHLRHVLARSERGTEAIAPVVVVSGAVMAAAAVATVLPVVVLGIMGGQGELDDAGLVRALYVSLYVATGLSEMVGAVFLGSLGYAMVKGEVAEPWLGYLGLAMSALFVATSVSSIYLGSYSAFWTAMGIVALLGFSLFVLAAGVMMLIRPEQERAAQRVPLLQTT